MRARGFTLIEVLVSQVVLTIGLLGAAAVLLQGLRGQANALRRVAATGLVRDMADRIRANPQGRTLYDTRSGESSGSCAADSGCSIAQRAAADLAHFNDASAQLFPHAAPEASVIFEPATDSATPASHVVTLRWRDARDEPDGEAVALEVWAALPVAG